MQVNQSVNAANFMQIGSQANAAPQNAKAETLKGEQSFASFLKPAEETQNKSESVNTEDKSVKDLKSEKISNTDNSVKEDKTTKKSDKDTDVRNVDKSDQKEDSTVDTQTNSTPVDEEEVLTEEETEAVFETVSQLLQVVMNEFNLEPEEIEVKLDSFGMKEEDLLTTDGLKEFFLNMKEAEPSDLIVNEDLNLQFNDFVKDVNEIIDSIDFPVEAAKQLVAETEISDFADYVAKPVIDTEEKSYDMPVVSDKVDVKEVSVEEPVVVEEPKVIVADNRQTDNNQGEQGNFNGQERTTEEKVNSGESHVRRHNVKETKTPFENPFLQAVNEAVDNITAKADISQPQVDSRQIIEQIVEQVRVEMNHTTSSLEMQLYPEHLGKIQIQVVSKDGVMTARIAAETEAARQAIEGGLANLREAMEQQDIKVEAIEVMVSTAGFGQNDEEQNMDQQQKSSKSNRNINLAGLDEEEIDEESAEAEKMKAVGSSVSYTA